MLISKINFTQDRVTRPVYFANDGSEAKKTEAVNQYSNPSAAAALGVDDNKSKKYITWATTLATVVAAGYAIYRYVKKPGADVNKKKPPLLDQTDNNPIVYKFKRTFEHIKDNFLAANKAPELTNGNQSTYEFMKRVRVDKDGKSILKNSEIIMEKRGIKRVDELLPVAGIKKTTFVTNEGKLLANINYADDGTIFQYWIKDANGNIIRDYNYTELNVTTKAVFNRDNKKVLEVQFDGSGWTRIKRFDSEGNVISDSELNTDKKLKFN